MTTIAYKDGVIAYDSRETAGTTIIDDECNKHSRQGEVDFFLAGCTADFDKFYYAYQGGEVDADMHIVGLAVEGGDVWYVAYNQKDNFWKTKVLQGKVFACGSGSSHALTAMDMGATAADAVRMAIKRDSCSGGKVNEFRVAP
jgi:20S proteasome alpha/beta subunit